MQKTGITPVCGCRLLSRPAWLQVVTKIAMIMKLIFLLLTTVLLHASAASVAQTVSVSVRGVPLKTFFSVIKKQTGFVLLATEGDLRNTKAVTITAENMPLRELLDKVFSEQPVKYGIKGKTIFLSPKPIVPSTIEKPGEVEEPVLEKITGAVSNASGQRIPNVTVSVKGTATGVFANANGEFSIEVKAGAVLVFTAVGYEPQFYSVTKTSTIAILMKTAQNKLDEVQVIAYGQTSSRLSTGNISTVKAKDIERSPVTNPLLAIAGRVPGVFITQTTGFSGAGVQVQIQGRNSINSGMVPFYVVDGVPYVQSMLTPLSSIQGASDQLTGTGVSNPLAFLNPQDIESIDVLKDADATAIYGSRAANGAILITTKKGKVGRTNVTVNVQRGFGEVGRKMKNLNTEQYIALRKDAYTIQGQAIPTTPASTNYDLTVWDQNRYTDWQEVLIGGKADYTDVQATASGGNANTQVLFGANYHHETTVNPGSLADNRGSVHFNMSHTSFNQRFKMSFGGNYLTDKNVLPGVDLTSSAMKLSPNAPALYDSIGNLNWALLPNGGAETWINPIRSVLRTYNVNSNNLVGNSELSYRIWNTLTLKSSFGYTSLSSDEMLLTPQSFFAPSTTTNNRSAFYSTRKVTNWIIEPQLSYQMARSYGKFDLLAGTTFQKNKYNLQSLSTSGYSNDGQLASITAATSVIPIGAQQETYNYNAVFGRLAYNYQDKYLLNLSIRRDGSSRFGSENLFNNFYGIGAGWVFTKEKWWSKKLSFLSFGKLKASYGTTGNDQIGNYTFMSLYRTVGVPQPYGGGTTLRPNALSNPYIQWEETRKLNTGIDLGFLQDRILVNFNYYHNRSSNQLLGYNLPIITGFPSITENFAAVVLNKGFELAINSENLKSKNFSWSTSLNLTRSRNELAAFPGLATSSYANSLVIGEPLTITKAFQYAGVNPQTGRYNFQIPDKSLVEIPVLSRDETVLIDRTPKYYGGFQNTLTYKGISLDFLFQFTKQRGFDETSFGYSSVGVFSATSGTGNQPADVLGYWKAAGDKASYQRPHPGVAALNNTYAYASSIYSSAAWTDASYIRLKNMSLTYNLPTSLIKQAHMQQVRVYAQGQNLLTFTKYKGLDPENQSTFTLPPLRVITFGLQVSL